MNIISCLYLLDRSPFYNLSTIRIVCPFRSTLSAVWLSQIEENHQHHRNPFVNIPSVHMLYLGCKQIIYDQSVSRFMLIFETSTFIRKWPECITQRRKCVDWTITETQISSPSLHLHPSRSLFPFVNSNNHNAELRCLATSFVTDWMKMLSYNWMKCKKKINNYLDWVGKQEQRKRSKWPNLMNKSNWRLNIWTCNEDTQTHTTNEMLNSVSLICLGS